MLNFCLKALLRQNNYDLYCSHFVNLNFLKAMCSWSFVQSHFLCKNLIVVCNYWSLFDYFSTFVKNFLCYFFQKQASKDHFTQGKLLKTMLLNEKQSNLEKKIYGNISLYSQYFSPGTEVMFTKHTFTF